MDIVIIKRYNSASEAYIDAGLLRDNDIDCAVNGEDLINAMPIIGEQITLSVRKEDQARALDLLHEYI
ncbi:MAG: hypothetical protein RR980_02750 [Mucinivorans sp.]